jgi:multidrug resistance efflux pump
LKRAVLLVLVTGLLVAAFTQREKLLRARAQGDVQLTGFVEGEERILRSEVAGVVTAVLVREGDVVERGTPVVRIDARETTSRRTQQELAIRELEAMLERARRSVEVTRTEVAHAIKMAEADIDYARADLVLATKVVVRQRELQKHDVLAVQNLDEFETKERLAAIEVGRREEALLTARDRELEVRVAEETVASLAAHLEFEKEKLHELDVILSKHEVCADGPGTVQARLIRSGELAQPGRALVSLLDETDKYVRVYIPVPLLGTLKRGTRMSVELDATPGRTLEGTIEWIESQATFTPRKIYTPDDRTVQVYEARVRLPRGVARDVKAGAEAAVRVLRDAPPGDGP